MSLRLILFLVVAALSAQADNGAQAEYVGGTVADMENNRGGHIDATDDLFLEFQCKRRQIHVAYDKINLLEYGQNVDRRVTMAVRVSPCEDTSPPRRPIRTEKYELRRAAPAARRDQRARAGRHLLIRNQLVRVAKAIVVSRHDRQLRRRDPRLRVDHRFLLHAARERGVGAGAARAPAFRTTFLG